MDQPTEKGEIKKTKIKRKKKEKLNCKKRGGGGGKARTLLAELGLALLDGGEDHVADTGSGEPVQVTLDAVHGNDVEVLGSAVVSAVHDGSHGQTEGHAELGSSRDTAYSARENSIFQFPQN